MATEYRKKKLSIPLLKAVVADLKLRKIKTVLAIPKIKESLDDGEAWNGPQSLFERAGFKAGEQIDDRRVYFLQF